MNDSWGWNSSAEGYKSARDLVHALCEVAGRGGNLLLNVSPTADGSLPWEQVECLGAIATWMAAHAESIHDTAPGRPLAVLRAVDPEGQPCLRPPLFRPDPTGEVLIQVPERLLDPLATVLAIDLD